MRSPTSPSVIKLPPRIEPTAVVRIPRKGDYEIAVFVDGKPVTAKVTVTPISGRPSTLIAVASGR